jgi:hypothetical protein
VMNALNVLIIVRCVRMRRFPGAPYANKAIS